MSNPSEFDFNAEDFNSIDMWSRSNARSVWNRVPRNFQNAMDRIPEKVRFTAEPYLFRKGKPSKQVQDARQRFWHAFTLNDTRKVTMNMVFNYQAGAYQSVMGNEWRLMWFLTPPADMISGQRSMLERTMDLVRDVLKEDNLYVVSRKIKKHADGSEDIEESRELNTKAMAEVRKLLAEMTDRVHGTSVQRHAVAHQMMPNPLQQMTSADSILNAANETDQPPKLEEGEVVELDDSLRNDLVSAPIDVEADIGEFMDDEPVD